MLIDKTRELRIEITHKDCHYKAMIEYGMKYHHFGDPDSINLEEPGQQPLFHLKGQIVERRLMGNNGWIYDFNALSSEEVLQYEPKIADLVPFALWTQVGLPRHYIAYGTLYYSHYRRWTTRRTFSDTESRNNWFYFCKHTLLDEDTSLDNITNIEELEVWLENRKAFLQQRFYETMKRHEIEYISYQEILETYERMKANRSDIRDDWGIQ